MFERVPCQTSMPRQDGACHQFTVFSREPYSVKVSDIQLQVQLKIMKLGENGQYTVLPENEPVVPLNNFLYSAYKVRKHEIRPYLILLLSLIAYRVVSEWSRSI